MICQEKCKNPSQLKQLLCIPLGWGESPEAYHGLLLFMSLLLEICSNVCFWLFSHIKKATSWFNALYPTDVILQKELTNKQKNTHIYKSLSQYPETKYQNSSENGLRNGLCHVSYRVWNKREERPRDLSAATQPCIHGIHTESECNLLVFHQSGINFIPHLKEQGHPECSLAVS